MFIGIVFIFLYLGPESGSLQGNFSLSFYSLSLFRFVSLSSIIFNFCSCLVTFPNRVDVFCDLINIIGFFNDNQLMFPFFHIDLNTVLPYFQLDKVFPKLSIWLIMWENLIYKEATFSLDSMRNISHSSINMLILDYLTSWVPLLRTWRPTQIVLAILEC